MDKKGHSLARGAWVSACRFHPASDGEILRAVTDRVLAEPGAVVLFDLDSTLYDTAARTDAIVREWLEATPGLPEAVGRAFETMHRRHVSYSLKDLFSSLGLDPHAEPGLTAWGDLKAFWQPRFFSNDYLLHDEAYEGAADFVNELHGFGARIAYLTGRDGPGMEAGTRRTLRRDGFPIGEKEILLMKPAREGDDFAHKVGLAETIRGIGPLAASFENEPRNLMGLFEAFPEAMHIFVETVCSDHPAPVCEGLYRLRGFVREN